MEEKEDSPRRDAEDEEFSPQRVLAEGGWQRTQRRRRELIKYKIKELDPKSWVAPAAALISL